MHDSVHEPLLQHYGISTTWLDVIDNIWVALWFAVHDVRVWGRSGQYIHFDRREIAGPASFGYIYLLAGEEDLTMHPRKGFMLSRSTEVVDLRVAAPSIFLRPHAQHGLLIRPRGVKQPGPREFDRPLDYSNLIRGIIKFKVSSGVEWLGNGAVHSIRTLFPPPYYDHGYRLLLNADLKPERLGSIQHIGA